LKTNNNHRIKVFHHSYFLAAKIMAFNSRKMSVPLLEDLAFEVSFKEMISHLVMCRDHRPKNTSESYKAMDWVSYSSVLSNHAFMSSENVLKFVKQRLNKYLVGVMGIKIRYKLLFIIICFLFKIFIDYLEPNMLKSSLSYLATLILMHQ